MTRHAPQFTPKPDHSNQHQLLSLVQSTLGGGPIRSLRRALNFLSGAPPASTIHQPTKQWSISSLFDKAKWKLRSPDDREAAGRTASSGRNWHKPLSLRPGHVLQVAEVEEGMEQVLKMAYEAAEAGSGQAWLFLGDLYLVSLAKRDRLRWRLRGATLTWATLSTLADRSSQPERQPFTSC